MSVFSQKSLHQVSAPVWSNTAQAYVWAEFDVTVDLYAVVQELAQKAFTNRTRRAREIGGAILVDFVQVSPEPREKDNRVLAPKLPGGL